jgi:hypothetical protein
MLKRNRYKKHRRKMRWNRVITGYHWIVLFPYGKGDSVIQAMRKNI